MIKYLIPLFFFAAPVFAYDLNEFKSDSTSRLELNILPHISHSNDFYRYDRFSTSKSNNSFQSVHLRGGYYKETEGIVVENTLFTSFSYSNYESHNYSDIESDKYIGDLIYKGLNHFYFTPKLFVNTEILANHTAEYSEGDNSENETSNTTYGKIALGIGKGREYEVMYAELALHIIKDLREAELLKRTFTTALIDSLAQEIHRLRNLRYFDRRNYKKRLIKGIDAFFVEHDIIHEYSVDYFNILQDMIFLSMKSRKVGARYSVNLKTDYTTFTDETNYKSGRTDYYMEQGMIHALNVSFRYSTALSEKWHFSSAMLFDIGLFDNEGSDSVDVSPGTIIDGSFAYLFGAFEIGFFLNTRTSFSLLTTIFALGRDATIYNDLSPTSVNTVQLYYFGDEPSTPRSLDDSFIFGANTRLSGTYYITERFSVLLSGGLNFQRPEYTSYFSGVNGFYKDSDRLTVSSRNHTRLISSTENVTHTEFYFDYRLGVNYDLF